jgi:hypothetical protein
MPLDAQIDIHLCSFYQHPPGGYVYALASSGKAGAYAIAERLRAESNEAHKAYLVEALEAIDQFSWRLDGDPALMELLKKEVAAIKDPHAKKRATTYWNHIQDRKGTPFVPKLGSSAR